MRPHHPSGPHHAGGRAARLRAVFLCLALVGVAAGVTACASSGGPSTTKGTAEARRSRAYADDSDDEEPGLLMRMLGRGRPTAPPEPAPFEERGRVRPKKLTVPQDTVNALKLMAQDWVLKARDRGPRVRRTPSGTYVREYNTFGDKYTLEIERPDSDDDDATMLGFVFLDSLHYLTAERPTREAATADTAYREERRKLRMTFRLLERWEFSELAEEFVFNRVWELARVQYKPVLAPVPASPAAAPRAVAPPEATPRTR